MIHNREEVIQRTIREYQALDQLVSGLTDEEWQLPLLRPESKDPWTVKDALAHITHWKADVIRSIKKQRRPKEEQGLTTTAGNHLVYMRWRDASPAEVLQWHRQVQQEVLEALKNAPDEYFTSKEHPQDWPNDLDSHSTHHRIHDIEGALAAAGHNK